MGQDPWMEDFENQKREEEDETDWDSSGATDKRMKPIYQNQMANIVKIMTNLFPVTSFCKQWLVGQHLIGFLKEQLKIQN